jgi:hypothetical protein
LSLCAWVFSLEAIPEKTLATELKPPILFWKADMSGAMRSKENFKYLLALKFFKVCDQEVKGNVHSKRVVVDGGENRSGVLRADGTIVLDALVQITKNNQQ